VSTPGPVKIMLVAAEPSGDTLGAGLARALKARLGDRVSFIGVGGPKMAEEGIVSPFDIGELSVLGIVEGLKAYPRVVRRADETAALAARERPDVAVLIDSWGFTLRVAKRLKALTPPVRVLKYVGPQVWASRPGRAATLAATVDGLLATQPMDAPFYQDLGLPVTFVGNPALARDVSHADGERFRAAHGLTPDQPMLLVLPGSRTGEVQRLLKPFEAAVAKLSAAHPDLAIVVPAAASVAGLLRAEIAGWSTFVLIVEDEQARLDAMKAATAALACSGTVTTELALCGCPMVVAYRLSPLSHFIIKRMITTRYITLFNIAADREIAPERVQDQCTGDILAKDIHLRLTDASLREQQRADQFAALTKMGRGGGDPAERAAEAVIADLQRVGALN
jgi:lipid-A-disaccharide synthase